jgi:hypothetical protein
MATSNPNPLLINELVKSPPYSVDSRSPVFSSVPLVCPGKVALTGAPGNITLTAANCKAGFVTIARGSNAVYLLNTPTAADFVRSFATPAAGNYIELVVQEIQGGAAVATVTAPALSGFTVTGTAVAIPASGAAVIRFVITNPTAGAEAALAIVTM